MDDKGDGGYDAAQYEVKQTYEDEEAAADGGYVEEGVEEEDDDDEWDEEEEELLRNIGEHPLLDRVQKRLWDRLQRKKDRTELELREVQEDAARAKKEREDIGVELYGLQQQLAKLQMQLEGAHNNSHLIADIRKKAEADLIRFREAYKERKSQVDEEERKMEHAKSELDGINETIRQVEAYNAEMKSEIAVTRRETYAAEEAVSSAEKDKAKQDLYIDRLNEQFKRLSEQLALYETRIAAQQSEAKAAADTLAEAVEEMEGIHYEKKQLLQQWQSSLVGMQKRDEALQATHKAIRDQQEAEDAMRAEDTGFKKDMQKAQAENSALMERYEKSGSELAFLESQLGIFKRQREALAERYDMLQKSLAQTDQEADRLRVEAESLKLQIAALEQDRQTVDRKRQELEAGFEANVSTQTTVQKAAANLVKDRKKVLSVVHAKEMERAGVENELARVKVDTMNVEAHVSQLRATLDECNKELRDKDQLIEKYQMEIRQRNDSIEKKMHVVDRLNRKYEKLTAGMEDENMGPLEATIKNLRKQIGGKGEASEALQRQWLADQTLLVDAANDVEAKEERVRDMESQHTLALQKRRRLDGAISQQQAEIKQLQADIAKMHHDMTRLNTLIAKNDEMSKKLAETNFSIEKEFMAELRELEHESVGLESAVAELKEEKARLLEDVLEAERQNMLWDKKIALEKETQAALDPSVGMSEAADMEREIHRMKLRYETLRRDQERLIKEMERAIDKRESIELRFKGRSKAAKASKAAPPTQAGLKKQLGTLRKALRSAKIDTAGYEEALELKQGELRDAEARSESKTRELEAVEREAADLQQTINSTLYDKQRSVERLAGLRRMSNRFEALERGHHPGLSYDDAAARLGEAQEDQMHVRELIAGLQEAHPGMGEVLRRVAQLLDS